MVFTFPGHLRPHELNFTHGLVAKLTPGGRENAAACPWAKAVPKLTSRQMRVCFIIVHGTLQKMPPLCSMEYRLAPTQWSVWSYLFVVFYDASKRIAHPRTLVLGDLLRESCYWLF